MHTRGRSAALQYTAGAQRIHTRGRSAALQAQPLRLHACMHLPHKCVRRIVDRYGDFGQG
jgi:hypothetical protein